MRIALKIAPQHSTQYADMATRLAEPELRASPAGEAVTATEVVRLAGHAYVLATLGDQAQLAGLRPILSRLGATSEIHEYFDTLRGEQGPFLRPVEPAFAPQLPLELAEARRYKGKTSEVFTRVLVNLALFAGAFRDRAAERLRVVDPLAGGGTTLFVALALGHDAFGVERTRRDVETTVSFVEAFCREARIPHRATHDRAQRRHVVELGPRGDQRLLVLAEGDTRETDALLQTVPGGAHMHAVAADLPYGIQHAGETRALVAAAATAWEHVLVPGGAIALAWDATRLPREEIVGALAAAPALRVRDDEPYARLEHRVDRVIKKRDVVVAVKEAER
jgi:hypothetical protein